MVSGRQTRESGVKEKSASADSTSGNSAPVSPLEAHLGYWLRFVSNQVSHSFSSKLADRDVSVAEWVVLRELYECESMAPSVLAEKIGMTRGAISKLADRLVAKALVTRTTSEEDRRFQALALTAKGRTIVPRLAALADKNDAEFFGHLKAAEQETIKAAMREIVHRHGLKSVPVE
jgi:DNA-binding MarR family transcriptional regulator